jgi:hypothetical protein
MIPITMKKIPVPRQCGGCSECCEVMGVRELEKPPLTKCKNQCDTGCTIYDSRPATCREWTCSWVRDDEFLSDRDRPNEGGLLFVHRSYVDLLNGTMIDGSIAPLLKCHEVTPGALDRPRSQSVLDRLNKKGYTIIVYKYQEPDGGRAMFRLPIGDKHQAVRMYVESLIIRAGGESAHP